MSTVIRQEYVRDIFRRQCEIALDNLQKFHAVVGDKISVLFMTGTDFGTQTGPFIAPETYCELYQPFQKKLNEWVHEHTGWKTFIHSCGSVWDLIPHFIDAGFDILNPVQCSAAKMDAKKLKETFGHRISFWGGGIDTQHTLPFGTAEEVRKEVQSRIKIFCSGGGFVFNTIHNVQPGVSQENVVALYRTFQEFREY
jgi:uroporphyrinogen-III decarboxylase